MNFEREGTAGVIHLPQRCEGRVSKELYAVLQDEQARQISEWVIDFGETTLMDSSTIGMLVTIDKDFKSRKVMLTLKNLNDDIAELFADTGLDMIFNIANNEGDVTEASFDLFEESIDIRLEVETEINNDICIFHMNGVMNHPVGSRFFKQQFLLAIAEYKKILLDFEDLTFFDSLSVSVVLSMHKLLKETGGNLRFCNTNYIVNDLFTTLNINQIIPMFETIEGALADWS